MKEPEIVKRRGAKEGLLAARPNLEANVKNVAYVPSQT
jgi:hypothetical protein